MSEPIDLTLERLNRVEGTLDKHTELLGDMATGIKTLAAISEVLVQRSDAQIELSTALVKRTDTLVERSDAQIERLDRLVAEMTKANTISIERYAALVVRVEHLEKERAPVNDLLARVAELEKQNR